MQNKKYFVKSPSPLLNYLIGKKSVDNKGFTSGIKANFYRIGGGEINNLYVSDIENAFAVFCSCNAKEALFAKARDIKNQVNSAIQQFDSTLSIVHVGMETFDGPEVENSRFEKIRNTIENIDPQKSSLRWIICHFFQSYSTPDKCWIFDETVNVISPYHFQTPPINNTFLIVPEDADTVDGISHWERPLP